MVTIDLTGEELEAIINCLRETGETLEDADPDHQTGHGQHGQWLVALAARLFEQTEEE